MTAIIKTTVQYDQLTPEYNNPAALLPNTENEDDNKEVKNHIGMWTNIVYGFFKNFNAEKKTSFFKFSAGLSLKLGNNL